MVFNGSNITPSAFYIRRTGRFGARQCQSRALNVQNTGSLGIPWDDIPIN